MSNSIACCSRRHHHDRQHCQSFALESQERLFTTKKIVLALIPDNVRRTHSILIQILRETTMEEATNAMAGDDNSSRSKSTSRRKNPQHYLRQWKRTAYGAHFHYNRHSQPFVLMSYNILSQDNLEKQPQLYAQHDQFTLPWNYRLDRLKKEIEQIRPAILCLQEVQDTHLAGIVDALRHLNYDRPLFKRRNGDQSDGCAIFYNRSLFKLVDHHFVEFFQPQISVSAIGGRKKTIFISRMP